MSILRVAAWLAVSAPLYAATAPQVVASPDRRVEFRLLLGDDGGIRYAVTFRGQPVIEPSPLGITVDGVRSGEGAQLIRVECSRTDQRYRWRGVHSTAVDRSNGAALRFRHAKTGAAFVVEVRAYDDGVAFRHIVPGAPGGSRSPDEATEFRLPAGAVVWTHDFEGHYEGVHARKPIEEAPAGEWAAPPLAARLPGGLGSAAITEAALVNYSGMGLQANGRLGYHARLGHAHPVSYPFRLRYAQDMARLSEPAAVVGTITTPWRVVMIGADLNALVNCDIVHNLAPPPDPKLFPEGLDTPWLRPGRSVWRYLDGGDSTLEGDEGIFASGTKPSRCRSRKSAGWPPSRAVEIPLRFLGQGAYHAVLVRDPAGNPAAVEIEKAAFRRGQSLRIALQAGGGFIGRFTK